MTTNSTLCSTPCCFANCTTFTSALPHLTSSPETTGFRSTRLKAKSWWYGLLQTLTPRAQECAGRNDPAHVNGKSDQERISQLRARLGHYSNAQSERFLLYSSFLGGPL